MNEKLEPRFGIQLKQKEPLKVHFYTGAEFNFTRQKWMFTKNNKIIRAEDWKFFNTDPYYPIMKDLVSTYNEMSVAEMEMSVSLHSSTLHTQIKQSPNNFTRSNRNGCFYFACAAKDDYFVKVSNVVAFNHEAEEICRNKGQVLWSPLKHRLDLSTVPDMQFVNIWTGIKRYNTSHFYYQDQIFKIEDKWNITTGSKYS